MVEVALVGGGLLKLTELQWQLDHFDFRDGKLAANIGSGSVHTFHVALPDASLYLEQFDSSFWCSSAVGARAMEAKSHTGASAAPRWRKRSSRLWPHVAGIAVPFIGQAHIAGSDVYLFRMASGPVLLHRVERFEQDAEDHYDQEG